MTGAAREPLLEAVGLAVGYNSIPVVRDLALSVAPGEIVTLLGPNGAGKTTTLRALAGELPALAGEVRWQGQRTTAPLHVRAARGLRFVTEERSVFMTLSVHDNLRLSHRSVDGCLALFPELEPLLSRRAGLLSGGEQQMLTLARALAGDAKLLLADEVSLGLAPLVVERLLTAIRDAADRGMGVLMVEQQVRHALGIADRGFVLRRGRVVMSGTSAELMSRVSEIEDSYLATAGAEDTP
ncbi:MAG TPA: ABC transporter ATP-binding protein [Amycolatopsis sp.]|nr:ABC transporter ATP-binding protein [Amycolatopsis sp.]